MMQGKLLLLFGLLGSGCATTTDPPDLIEPIEPTCPATWREAYTEWYQIRCARAAECFPIDEAKCVDYYMSRLCKAWTPEGACDWEFPQERCEQLNQCFTVDAPAVACTADATVPESCTAALQ